MALALFLRLMAIQAPLLRTGTITHNLQPSLDVSNMCPGCISLNADWKRVGGSAPDGLKQIQKPLIASGLLYFGLLELAMANNMPGLDMFVLFVIALSIT